MALDDFRGSLHALHPYGSDKDIHGRKPPLRDMQNIPDDRACGRGDYPDPPGEKRNGFLVSRIKKALRQQAGFKLFKCLLEGAQALWFHHIHDQLVFAPRLIDTHPSAADDTHPFFQIEPCRSGPWRLPLHGKGPEDDGPDLTLFILEGEVYVARCRPSQIGYLAFHPKRIEARLEELLDIFI